MVLRHVDLEHAVARQDVQPTAEVAFALDDLTQALTAVRHEHPPAVDVGREQTGNEVGSPRGEQADDAGLVRHSGMLALNQTSPPVVGMRSTVDHGRTCGCSMSPVDRRPSSSSCRSSQPLTPASQ